MSEILGVLFAIFVATMVIPKFADVQKLSNDNARASTTAQQQKQLISAATDYIKQNSVAVQAAATSTTPAVITVAMLQATAMLPSAFSASNPYGQTWQVEVLQPTAGNLQALAMSIGGTALSDTQAGKIAALVGAAGGLVPQNDSGIYPGAAANAYGAFAGWTIPTTNYTSVTGGHPAALLTFNNGQLVSNYLYRNAVPGQPQLNTMNTPLILGSGTVQTSGGACAAADLGSLARDASSNVLMCNGTKWQPQGSAYWQDPVSNYATLTGSYPCNAASAWQTRVVQTPTTGSGPRAYTCNGATWAAIAVDDSGNMSLPGVLSTGKVSLTDTVVEGAACTANQVSRDANGLILSCQSGIWDGQGIGSGQRWTDVTAIRSFGVGYLNSTFRPIQVSVITQSASGNTALYVDGIALATWAGSSIDNQTLTAIIPKGSQYFVSASGSVAWYRWAELR